MVLIYFGSLLTHMFISFAVAVCGCYYTRSLSELRMEKVTWHSERPVILYTTFSSVRNVGNTFMACVQGKTSNRFFLCLNLSF